MLNESESSSESEDETVLQTSVQTGLNIVIQAVAQSNDIQSMIKNSNWSRIPRSVCDTIAEKHLKLIDDEQADEYFMSFYRLNQKEFSWLVSNFPNNKRCSWDIRYQTMIFLNWMASKIHIKELSLAYDMPKTSVYDSLKRVLKFVMKLQNKIITLPTDPNELRLISYAFFNRANDCRFLRNVVGAIDGSLVKLIVPEEQLEEYFDRHLNTSINITCICDHQMLVRFLMIGKTGACHDMNVLKATQLYQQRLFPPENYVILGDSAYTNTFNPISIITPFKKSSGQELLADYKTAFNAIHSRVRSTIERTYGDIKNKWRRIHKNVLECHIEMAVDVIAASCILNNITLGNFHERRTVDFTIPLEGVDFQPETRFIDCNDANEFREKIAQEFQR